MTRSDTIREARRHRWRIRAALARKEWREQRWRFYLGTLVLTVLLSGLLRAQVIPQQEAALLIYWPIGVILVVFLAMGPVATERSDRTWEFLVAQPVPLAEVLRVKWLIGLLQLVGMMSIATTCGLLAMWSRGFRMMPAGHFRGAHSVEQNLLDAILYEFSAWLSIHPVIQLCVVATASTVSLACWYTPLFLILTRARNEFTAALGGILLTLVVHAWLAQFFGFGLGQRLLIIPALFNPLSGLVLSLLPGLAIVLPILIVVHVPLWIVLPVYLMRRCSSGGGSV